MEDPTNWENVLRQSKKRELERARREASEKRRAWAGRLASDALSNMLGTLMAAGVVALFLSALGTLHELSGRDLAWIAAAVSTLFALTAWGALRYEESRLDAEVAKDKALLEQFVNDTVERSRQREEEIREMNDEGKSYSDD